MPASGGPRLFVQISDCQPRHQRPSVGDVLIYERGTDRQGRNCATKVRFTRRQAEHAKQRKGISVSAKFIGAALIGLGIGFTFIRPSSFRPNLSPAAASSSADQAIGNAFQAHASGVQLSGEGVVERILADDNKGSRHQRFILRLPSGQTLLVAHNIDLAPRIEGLKNGDRVAFYGQYEWKPEGGVIHWTHHDPNGQHISGWLKHNGVVFQ